MAKQRLKWTYIVTVPASGRQSFLVYATSKAEAVRKCRNSPTNNPDVDPLEGDLDKLHWSQAEVSLDETHIRKEAT
jgi:hypothetical protein